MTSECNVGIVAATLPSGVVVCCPKGTFFKAALSFKLVHKD
jgi:hypothetical protein